MARFFRYLHDALFQASPVKTKATHSNCVLYTTSLYAMPTTISGAARVFDVMGVFDEYNSCATGEAADYRALKSDWLATGCDLRTALKTWEADNSDSLKRSRSTANEDHSLVSTR
jgi:hypothetical protein